MKMRFSYLFGVFISLFASFAMLVTPAAAAEKSITFLGAYLVEGKGVVFEFAVKGDFKDFPGTVMVGGQQFSLNCNFNDKGKLACTANHGLSRYIWQVAQGSVAGFPFSGLIRGTCHDVFDFYPDNGGIPPQNSWGSIGEYCGNSSPQFGDAINFYNPNYSDSYTYYYSNDGSSSFTCNAPDLGSGYYYNDCVQFQ